MNKEKLVVEVVAAHNLMPKDGEGSSSPFVEVEFENQRQKTHVKYKDLNPVWNEKLVFHLNDVADLPYRTIEVNVFNEKRSSNSRNFLGKVRVSGSSIVRAGEEVAQLFTLDKRSLFSHVKGEISLKVYLSTKEEVKQMSNGGNEGFFTKNKKFQQQKPSAMAVQQHQQQQISQDSKVNHQKIQTLQHPKPENQSQGYIRPIFNTNVPVQATSAMNGFPAVSTGSGTGTGGGGFGGGFGVISNRSTDFSLKDTTPHLGGESLRKDKTSSTYDLVEQMQYLYVRVVKARELLGFGGGEVVAEVKLGNYRGTTERVGLNNAEWNQVFAFSKDCIQSSAVEVFVKERDKDDFLGRVCFDLNEVPKRVPPDSQLAPQWHRMEDKRGESAKARQIMVAIWFGTQTDEAFSEAWHSKAANIHLDGLCSLKSKVYLSPKLWYLRVSILEAQDIVLGGKGSSMMRYPELIAKVQVGNQVLRTRISPATPTRNLNNPIWNEDLIFVVADPFEDYLSISVEDRAAPEHDELMARVLVPITSIEKRLNGKPVASRWYNLDTHFSNSNEAKAVMRFASRIHLRASLDGGYHVLDEATMYSSDVKPTEKSLWKPHIGILEMGVLSASNLMPVKIKEGKGGCTDAYCVAKYGQKWVRTRTVVDSLSPKWNEQYTWEVYDPCTVITIGVFDNSCVEKNDATSGRIRDTHIGKVRIRLSTLESDHAYPHAYPLLMLHSSGLKKMGELHLAIRFTCANMLNVLHMYTMPLLPKMHYAQPLSVNQIDSLRYQALNVLSSRLSRAEPPLGREVVEYMLDRDSHMWSMRKSKANFFRLTNVVSWFVDMTRWMDTIRNWNKPVYSTLFLLVFIFVVLVPELVIPFILVNLAVLGLWRYKSRPRQPSHMDTRLSYAESVYPDELDEEFDSFPTSRSAEIIRMRYDRLRSVAGKIQTVVGNMATQGERFQALLSWRDPRATFLYLIICLIAAVGFYLVPIRWVIFMWGIYLLRPPKFRSKMPSRVVSFLKRLPTRADSML